MDEMQEFRGKLEKYVRNAAGGNKALAARMLKIPRLQLFRYLGTSRPRPEMRRRLEAEMVASKIVAVGQAASKDTVDVTMILCALRYLERLVTLDAARDHPPVE